MFIAYRHTGADPKEIEAYLTAIRNSLSEKGVQAYATFFDQHVGSENGMSPKDTMWHAFKKIDQLKGLFVIQTSDDKSEGQLMEVGYALAKGYRIIVATKSDVNNTYVPDMGDFSITWDDLEDLADKIKSLDL